MRDHARTGERAEIEADEIDPDERGDTAELGDTDADEQCEIGDLEELGDTDEAHLTIGEVARRAGVATSTVRYYERRGLLAADARRSGQRRYRPSTLRTLVSIGLLQDAGLSLDDIAAMLDATDKAEWRAIGQRRLASLEAEIARLQHSAMYLRGAVHCRFEHPLTECDVIGAEIDRRLAERP